MVRISDSSVRNQQFHRQNLNESNIPYAETFDQDAIDVTLAGESAGLEHLLNTPETTFSDRFTI